MIRHEYRARDCADIAVLELPEGYPPPEHFFTNVPVPEAESVSRVVRWHLAASIPPRPTTGVPLDIRIGRNSVGARLES